MTFPTLEGLLTAQAFVPNTLFVNNVMQAQANQALPNAHERLLRLALKARAQCRVTVEAIAEIKNSTVFAKHANIVSGHQQVNIGDSSARGRKGISADHPQAPLPAGDGTPLPGADPLGQAVPVARDAERAMPHARRTIAGRAQG